MHLVIGYTREDAPVEVNPVERERVIDDNHDTSMGLDFEK